MTVEEYDRQVAAFFDEATHRRWASLPGVRYAPMVELLRYLEANGFTSYIASGGDRDFMRPVAGDIYGIPPERVIGSALGLESAATTARRPAYKPAMDFFDDGPEKPVRIWSRIGRRPILVGGNSNGDVPMLAYSGRGGAGAAPAGPARRRRARVRLHRGSRERALDCRRSRAGRSSA